MSVKENEKKVLELTEIFKDANLLFLTNFSSISVSQITALRQKLKEEQGNCKVVKKSLATIALKNAYLENLVPHLENLTGVTGFVLGAQENAQRIAKVLTNFGKKFESFRIKAGSYNGKPLSSDEIQLLARLPSREAVIAELIGSLQMVIVKFLNLLQVPICDFVNVVNNIRKKKEKN